METKRERLIEHLSREIRTGALGGAKKLPAERALAARLGVTRGLLREALLTMEGMGLLSIAGRDGIYLKNAEMVDIADGLQHISGWPEALNRDILEVRLILEIPAAEMSARNRTEADLERMQRCLERLAHLDGGDKVDSRQGDEWDFLLHETIVRSTDNQLLIRIYEGISSFMKAFTERNRLFLFSGIPGSAEKASQEHKRLVVAIKEGDDQLAGEVMREHLYRTLEGRPRVEASPAP